MFMEIKYLIEPSVLTFFHSIILTLLLFHIASLAIASLLISRAFPSPDSGRCFRPSALITSQKLIHTVPWQRNISLVFFPQLLRFSSVWH